MKKVLLAGTALLGLAFTSAPASADIDLDLGGFTRFYGVYADNDEATGAANSVRDFEFRRDVELHFTGEATTDNGLTVGVHHELKLGGAGTTFNDLDDDGIVDAGEETAGGSAVTTDETYLYFSGNFGRFNLGQEDGAAYLLQVAAPSADSNVDGLRTYIQALNTSTWFPGGSSRAFALDYAHSDFVGVDRLTYLTPKWNGFQAGASYAAGADNVADGVAEMALDQTSTTDFEDLWELAARWDGEFEGFGISLGGGYSTADTELGAAGVDSLDTYNVGANVAFQGFGVGVAYKNTNLGGTTNTDVDTLVVGAGWDNGPYHLGASWLNQEAEPAALGTTGDFEVDRYTFGGAYTYGPGMSLRGAVAFGEVDANTAGTADRDFTQVTFGTNVKF